MSATNIAVLGDLIEGGDADGLPPAVQLSLSRHRENLASMVAALRAVGLDEAKIEDHLGVLIDSYRGELSAALHHIGSEVQPS